MAVVGQKETQLALETNPTPLPPVTRTTLLDEEQFKKQLKVLADGCGSNAELGRRLGVTGQFIDYLIAGKRRPGPKLLKAVQLRKVVAYEPIIEELHE
jgi:hypothetical protein